MDENWEDERPMDTNSGSGRQRSCCQRFLKWNGSMVVLSLVGAVIGFSLGFVLYHFKVSSGALVWVGLPGELYMRMLKAVVLPLIICSIISGTASLKPKENGRVSAVALTYIITTNITGALVGMVLAVIIKPGASGAAAIEKDTTTVDTKNLETPDMFADLIRNMVPDNLVAACFEKTQTMYKETTGSDNSTQYTRYLDSSSGTNILGLVVASVAIGMSSASLGEVSRPFLNFFEAASEVIIRLVQRMIWLTPLGVISLIAKAVASTNNMEATFKGLGLFVVTEVVGNFLTGVVILSLIYLVFMRRNPFVFLAGASKAVITGVAAASSAVAMPEVLTCVETRHNVDTRVSRFVVPLTTALNRDGSAMFIVVVCIYMAQLHGNVLASDVILITVLSSVGSLALPGVPSSSIVAILMILASLDIPPANIGIIIALEWFSDRMRAVPNVFGHVLCAVITWHFCKSQLQTEDDESNQNSHHNRAKGLPLSMQGKDGDEESLNDNSRL